MRDERDRINYVFLYSNSDVIFEKILFKQLLHILELLTLFELF